MSTHTSNKHQTIEEILEQIRIQAATPLGPTARQRAVVPPEVGEAPAACDLRADNDCAIRPAPAMHDPAPPDVAGDATWATGHNATADIDLVNDLSHDLPALLKRAAETTRSASVHTFPNTRRGRLSDALRRVRAPEPPIPPITSPSGPALNADSAAAEQPPVKRQMASFLDQRFKALSAPAPIADAPPDGASRQDGAQATGPAVAASIGPAVGLEAAIAALGASHPEALARTELGAAELLRPMLKQWLLENMPRIVEQALSMEMAENIGKTARNKVG